LDMSVSKSSMVLKVVLKHVCRRWSTQMKEDRELVDLMQAAFMLAAASWTRVSGRSVREVR